MNVSTAILYTDGDGRARFRQQILDMHEGSPGVLLSAPLPAVEFRVRSSPVGFRSGFHCTVTPQWVFVLQGAMEVGLQDGTTRVFSCGESFYAFDLLPEGVVFDARLHGHSSRQIGTEPLMTLFVPDGGAAARR